MKGSIEKRVGKQGVSWYAKYSVTDPATGKRVHRRVSAKTKTEAEAKLRDAITAADCVTAYLMDWANEQGLLAGKPNLQAYLKRMYDRPTAPQHIAEASASIRAAA